MKVTGEVLKIRYINETNGYSVFDLNTEVGDVKVVGIFDSIAVGEILEIDGEFVYDNKYGEQISCKNYIKKLPSSLKEIENYLSSGIISNIGKKNAKQIVEKFGNKSLDIIFDNTEKLLEIHGIGKKTIEKIKISVKSLRESKNILFYLTNLGISLSLSKKIYSIFKENTLEIINQNPYKLVKNIKGIGFLKADEIALKNNIDKNSPFRIESAIIYVLSQKAINFGHTYYPEKKLTKEVCDLIDVKDKLLDSIYTNLLVSNEIVVDYKNNEKIIYLSYLYDSENYVASKIAKMIFNKEFKVLEDIETEVYNYVKNLNIKLSKTQIDAVKLSLFENVHIITGGPGTGKTTIIKIIANIFLSLGYTIALAAPTGRASKRIEQTTNIEAKTIHRLLGYIPNRFDDFGFFEYNEENPLDTDIIIVDEISMVDIVLFENLLKALKENTKLIIVGDVDQLPSVGAGNVLRDLIDSNVIKYTKLIDIFRQSQNSNIILNAHRINNGKNPILNQKNSDFFFIKTSNSILTRNVIVDLISNRLPKACGYDFYNDIQILTQTKKGVCGIYELNRILQEVLNPKTNESLEIIFGNKIFRLNDKVMQIKNNYDLSFVDSNSEEGFGVYNGDMGIICKIFESEKKLTVKMQDERMVEYSFENLDNLELAYAITIHKSQGCEFKSVIIPLFEGFYRLQTRNLLYTAITRAKENIVLVGNEDIMINMINNNTINYRYSNLEERLKNFFNSLEDMLR